MSRNMIVLLRHRGVANKDASLEMPLLVALINLGSKRVYSYQDVMAALVDNNRKRPRYNFFYPTEEATWPTYIQVIQGPSDKKFDPSFMADRKVFPPELGDEIHHLGWLCEKPSITKYGLRPGGRWGTRRRENHGSALNPRQHPAAEPNQTIPGRYPYVGHLQGQDANYVWSNKALRRLGILVYQSRSYALLSQETWPPAALLRVESLDGRTIHWHHLIHGQHLKAQLDMAAEATTRWSELTGREAAPSDPRSSPPEMARGSEESAPANMETDEAEQTPALPSKELLAELLRVQPTQTNRQWERTARASLCTTERRPVPAAPATAEDRGGPQPAAGESKTVQECHAARKAKTENLCPLAALVHLMRHHEGIRTHQLTNAIVASSCVVKTAAKSAWTTEYTQAPKGWQHLAPRLVSKEIKSLFPCCMEGFQHIIRTGVVVADMDRIPARNGSCPQCSMEVPYGNSACSNCYTLLSTLAVVADNLRSVQGDPTARLEDILGAKPTFRRGFNSSRNTILRLRATVDREEGRTEEADRQVAEAVANTARGSLVNVKHLDRDFRGAGEYHDSAAARKKWGIIIPEAEYPLRTITKQYNVDSQFALTQAGARNQRHINHPLLGFDHSLMDLERARRITRHLTFEDGPHPPYVPETHGDTELNFMDFLAAVRYEHNVTNQPPPRAKGAAGGRGAGTHGQAGTAAQGRQRTRSRGAPAPTGTPAASRTRNQSQGGRGDRSAQTWQGAHGGTAWDTWAADTWQADPSEAAHWQTWHSTPDRGHRDEDTTWSNTAAASGSWQGDHRWRTDPWRTSETTRKGKRKGR